MDIKDYLHYYLGQQVLINNGIYENKIDSITHINLHGDVAENEYEWLAKDCQLILRKLEDMTEEEGGEVFQLERNRNPEKGGHEFDLWKEKYGFRITRFDLTEQHLLLGNRGELYWVVDVPKPNIQPANNTPLIFHYLLHRGFDLWNLIDSGQAVDVKTIKQ